MGDVPVQPARPPLDGRWRHRALLPAATHMGSGPAMGPAAAVGHALGSCRCFGANGSLPARVHLLSSATLGTWLCLLLLLAACVPTATSSPGIKGRVTRRALEYGRRFGLEMLRSLLQKEHDVNLQGSYQAPLLGRLNYTVPQIHIHELQMNNSTVDFAEDVGVQLTVHRAQIQLNATWHAQLAAWQDSGSLQLRIRDLAVAVLLGLGADEHGHPSVWAAGCDARGTDLHLQFHKGQSWLYNLLVPLLQRTLRQQLNKQLCVEIQKGISRLQDSLKNIRVSAQLDAFTAIDLSLVGQPVITKEHGDVDLKGEFFGARRRWQSPFSARPVGLPELQEPMLLVAITDFVANTAAFAYFRAEALHRNITADMLPRRFPLKLDTKSMGNFAPQLQQHFPNRPVELHLWARQQPLISCHPNALHGALFGSAEAFVVLPNATRVPAFLLNIDANVTGKPTIAGNRLGGTVKLKSLRVMQVMSHVGPLQVEKLENTLRFGLWLFGVPWADKRLRPGIPLPTPHGITLLNPRLSLHEGFMLITTDLQYEP
ncbi:bactericidal permeability-increasing protein-like isoform X2 [Coturnix japonica]|uniref:bactericidal permeability-increasing protein-like isoform X2 n=1 Tax=Coturnix japonica TaxID=93934 RepID=UPI00077755DB|nr:bactericidal permeability-increasing protein-like isoform X2 [Coturnix japonica]